MTIRSKGDSFGRRIGAVVALVALAWSGVAVAQPRGAEREARAAFDRGVAAFERQEYAEALEAFWKAYELSPQAATLYHVGSAQRMLDDIPAARETLRLFLSQTADGSEARLREEAQRSLDEMDRLPCSLMIEVDRAGALVFVDDLVRGVSPLAIPVDVPGGSHVVRVRLAGFVEHTETVELPGGEAVTVSVALEPVAGTQVAQGTQGGEGAQSGEGGQGGEPVGTGANAGLSDTPEGPAGGTGPEPADEPGRGGLSPWFWVAVGVGAATGAVAIGTGAVALSDLDSYESAAARDRETYDRIVALELTTDVMIGLTAAAGVAALLVGLLVDGGEEQPPGGEGPGVAVGPTGLVVSW